MDLNKLLKDKEAALAHAKAQVLVLEKQIKTLSESLAMLAPTEFEEYLASKPKDSISLTPIERIENRLESTRQRNRKGEIQKIILSVLTNADQHLKKIEGGVNLLAARPITLGQLRTVLMNLKNEGFVKSDRPGFFRLA
ncbi:MAG: hypothetical protein WCB36_04485 [Burkholderiales bacterium]